MDFVPRVEKTHTQLLHVMLTRLGTAANSIGIYSIP